MTLVNCRLAAKNRDQLRDPTLGNRVWATFYIDIVKSTPVIDVVGRQRLRSATQQLMVVPRHRLTTVGRRAFAVHGPMVWNSLPADLRTQQDYESFRQGLKTWLFSRY